MNNCFFEKNKRVLTRDFIVTVLLYLLVVILDTYTTYMGAPDLSKEDLFIVKNLGFGWLGLILSGFVWVTLVIVGFGYSHYLFYNTKIFKITNGKFIMALFAIIAIHYHVMISSFATINNYFVYLINYETYNYSLYNISYNYVNFMKYRYYIYLRLFVFFIAIIITIFYLSKRKIKVIF